MNSGITTHTIIKNEDRWIWYAIMSVINHVDKMLIYDTGSTDNTLKILKLINSPKIILKSKPVSTRKDLVNLRRLQLKNTKTPWFMLLDGDEIWPKLNFQKLLSAKNKTSSKTQAFFTRTRNSVGDIYHYLPQSKGRYHIKNKTGHLNIRLIRNHPQLKISGLYPLEAYTFNNQPIQNLNPQLKFVNTWYLHTTHLPRSTHKSTNKNVINRLQKQKFRLGLKILKKDLPQIFWQKRPSIVPAPITNRWKQLLNL